MQDRRTFLKQAALATLLGPVRTTAALATFDVAAAAEPEAEPADFLGSKPHVVLQGNGRRGWIARAAEYRFLHKEGGQLIPFGVVQMDNGEVALVSSWDDGDFEKPHITFSRNGGRSWSDLIAIPDVVRPLNSTAGNRPVGLAYLGNGQLTFQLQGAGIRLFSSDYGRTWPERITVQPPSGGEEPGAEWGLEGNPLVDRDEHGVATRIAEIRWLYPRGANFPLAPSKGMIRFSSDGGRTWTDDLVPPSWHFQVNEGDTTYIRGVSEGSLVRAKNGLLVAGLRIDMPTRYFAVNSGSLEGLAVSISKDDGATWSEMQILFEAGRHHQHLLRLPSGALVMTYVVRDDIRGGTLASYRRGCEAVVSRDHGRAWDVSRRYVLDGNEYLHRDDNWAYGACGHLGSALLDDGFVLTCYANYLTNNVSVIRWRPDSGLFRDAPAPTGGARHR